MRTLSRPMFNMGGPIKQGIMHGIREPYRGGQLVRPGPGRPGYAGPKDKIATGILTKVLPKIGLKPGFLKPWGQKVKGWFGSTGPVTKTVPRHGPPQNIPGGNIYSKGYPGGKVTGKNIGPGSVEVTEQIFKPGGPLRYLQASPEGKAVKWLWDGKGWVAKAAAMPFKSPLVALGLTYTGGKWLWPDGTPASKDEIKEIKKSGDVKDKVKLTITQEQRDAKAKADKEKRINALLDTMGYDKARKNAAYDALIDAGRMVSERGTLDTKNIGRELIDPIVATTSQRFDKPEQIREAVGLMKVKADIAKQLEDPQDKELRRLQIKNQEKALAGNTLEETAEAIYTRHNQWPTGEALAYLARNKNIPIVDVVDTGNEEVGDPVAYMEGQIAQAVQDGVATPPGNYVIGKDIIIVDSEGNVSRR